MLPHEKSQGIKSGKRKGDRIRGKSSSKGRHKKCEAHPPDNWVSTIMRN